MNIRSYQSGDEKGIMTLDASALPSKWNPRTLENWNWKFTARNPNGHSLIWAAEHEGRIVAHFAAVPYELKVFDREMKASHSIGALVEVKYQNRGLLKLVGDKLMEDLKANAIAYTWGFPNKRAYEFEKTALGYYDLIQFPTWVIRRDVMKQNPVYATVKKIDFFGPEFDELWANCAPGYNIAVVRRKAYLNWRYLERPDWEYFPFALYENNKLRGYIVYKLYREEDILRGHIIDIFSQKCDIACLSQMIDHAMNFFIDRNAHEITVLISGNAIIEELLAYKGFDRMESRIPLILKVNGDQPDKERVLKRENWYFTMGDSTEIY